MHRSSRQSGFTLIELLVSVAIFTIVITIAIGALLVLVDANARAQNMQAAITNVTFALDSIAREVRTGSGHYCSNTQISGSAGAATTRDCPSGASHISVIEGGESLTAVGTGRVAFRHNATDQSVERRVGDGSWLPITSRDVQITELAFYSEGSARSRDGDTVQPTVTIYVSGYAGELESARSSFALQTTVTKRILDI
jgi:prepilin-type N-terminal cleavage/methylation domain-containing protein